VPFKPFAFHGYLGNRRVVSFGWRYDYGARAEACWQRGRLVQSEYLLIRHPIKDRER
jgi:hypothetical protein